MAYYTRETLPDQPVLGARRPTINEYFLSSYTMSIYSGCEFACPYCDGWAYNPRSFSDVVRIPLELPKRLKADLMSVDRGDLVSITALSDPYQPVEQNYRLTRHVLQVFAEFGQPCLLLVKGLGVLDDIPLLQKIHERSLAVVMTTLLTVDRHMAERLEGKAPPPALRLDMLKTLKRTGIPVGVALLPLMPYVNDTDYAMRGLMQACVDVGVDFLIWDYLHIPNKRHRNRVNELLGRIGSYPVSYYRDVYGQETLPNAAYRQERNEEILWRCDSLGLSPRLPHQLYAGRLKPANEAALFLKHLAFRDATQKRTHMANMQRQMADLIYRGEATREQIANIPGWPTLFDILGLQKSLNSWIRELLCRPDEPDRASDERVVVVALLTAFDTQDSVSDQ